MRSKIPSTWRWIILGIAGIICVLLVIFSLTSVMPRQVSHKEQPQIQQNLERASSDIPVRLAIPKINVNAAIEYLGLTPQGAMAVPAGPKDAAWFDLGPYPGKTGSAVIAGHEGWKDGVEAVFDDLYKLHIGDKVYVGNEQGATTTFVVSGIQTYGQNGDAADIFSSSDGKAHLNLITCEGTWNAAEKSYSNRLVVFTDKE
jgi:LPXTG-site transpeptidase (sortase) family protein